MSYDHNVVLDGVRAFVFSVEDGGRKITVAGWDDRHGRFKRGERVLLVKPGTETRYRIVEVRRPGDPTDMYFMDCTFDPRPMTEEPTEAEVAPVPPQPEERPCRWGRCNGTGRTHCSRCGAPVNGPSMGHRR